MSDTSSERKHYEYIGRTVDHLGKKISALEDENAKLRDELANAPKCEACEAMLDCDECLRADGSHKERRRLSAESAKLRELMRIMAYCNQFRRDCDGCSMNGAAGIITERAGCDELLARLRDLGVEVDG